MIGIMVTLLGVALGSFVNALVWRVYMSGLAKSKRQKAKSGGEAETYSILKGRSMCPECKHQLGVKDLVPVLSWISLKGKCRYCKKPISWQYPLVELLSGGLFLISYVAWPYSLATGISYIALATWLALVTIGLALVVYDLKWMILPNRLVYPFGLVGVLYTVSLAVSASNYQIIISSAIGSVLFGGFFYVMYQISGGKWIGGGDVRLGFILGIILGWQKSILSLTLAAYLGTFVILVLYILGKYHRKMKLPFGPFLLTALFVTILWGQSVIDWYLRLSGI